MAKYDIHCDLFLGYSHSGPVETEGNGTVELTDEEVATLVDLMCEKHTADVAELDIENSHPELYEKLDDAYSEVSYHADYMHWLWEGYYNGYFEYDHEELMEYCEDECGFSFEYNEQDYLDEDGELDEYELNWAKQIAFDRWLDQYVKSLDDDEAESFFTEFMNADVETGDVEYEVRIPQAIVDMAKERLRGANG